jgi:hypothetical protein
MSVDKIIGMSYAYVTTNLLDLWSEPDFHSERVNQAFFGDLLTLGPSRGGFRRVTKTDSYKGWVDRRFLAEISQTRKKAYRRRINAVVGVSTAKLTGPNGRILQPHFLYYGTLLTIRKRSRGWAVAELPDGLTVHIKTGAIRPIKESTRIKIGGARMIAEAKKFLGVPYLWGGISPAGFDCSGLVQTICARFGLQAPRDTKDQMKLGMRIERGSVCTGDLCFFRRHVGIAIGRDRLIHASRGGGGVRINSIVRGGPDYRPDLDKEFLEARRIP